MENVSMWSPRHRYVAELKMSTENVVPKESCIPDFRFRPAEWRKNDHWRDGEAAQEQRSTTAKRK